jgi:hypothetical protein
VKLTMLGRITDCFLLAYRTPLSTVRDLVPPPLELITHRGYAFWNIVLCRVENMRPSLAPKLCGMSYHHVAYRLYVRARTASGQLLDGLYFVRSDADSRFVSLGGNVMTDFQFHPALIDVTRHGPEQRWCVQSRDGVGDASILIANATPTRPASIFDSEKSAADFLKYRPRGLSVAFPRLRIAEVFRDESRWLEEEVDIREAHWRFFNSIGQNNLALERATRVAPIDYRWRLGRTERLEAPPDAALASPAYSKS